MDDAARGEMLTTVDKVLFLMRVPATAQATTDALSRIATFAHELELPAGHRLFAVGDAPEAMFVVLDGAIRVEGIETPSRLAGPGEVLAGLELFAGGAHASSATAAVTSRVLRIPHDDLQDLLDEDGELARALFGGLLRATHAASATF